MSEANEYGIRAVERAGAVLRALAAADGPSALPAVANAARLSRPTTFRLLRTLESLGFVASVHSRYTLGIGILELAHSLTQQLDVAAIARPFLTELRNELDETCGLSIRSGDFCVPIVVIEALQSVRRVVPVGAHLALYAGSTGKVLLALDDELDLDAYLARTELVPFSSTTTTDPDALRSELQTIREQGVSWGINGRGDSGASVSFPIFRYDGHLVAATSIVCPSSRFNDELRDRCLKAGLRVSRQISEALGYRFPVPSPSSEPGT